MIIALESGLWAVFTSRVLWRTILFIGHIPAVSITITPEVSCDTVTGSTLERAVFALEAIAAVFIRIVPAVIFVIAAPSSRYTFAVVTAEFRFRTFSVATFALTFYFIRTITTIV